MDFTGKLCPYCKAEIKKTDDVVICSNCEMPHHKECWIENQGCTTFGCTGTMQGINSDNENQNTQENINASIIYCTRCGKPNKNTDKFCPSCGNALTINPNANTNSNQSYTYSQQTQQDPYSQPQSNNSSYQKYESNNQYNPNYQAENDTSDLRFFIQTNDGFYIEKFSKIRTSNSSVTWNWSSFLFSTYWAFYRKMYGIGWALLGINFVSSFLGPIGRLVNIGIPIAMGMYGNKLYMNHVNNEIGKTSYMDNNQKQSYLNQRGGTSTGAVVGMMFGYIILLIIIASLGGY